MEKTPGPASDIISAEIRAACEEICAMDLTAIALQEAESMDIPEVSADGNVDGGFGKNDTADDE
jgi:hypothetical protein